MSIKKTIILSIITLVMFFLSFILLSNDYMNMVPVTFTITGLLFIYMVVKIFTKNDKKTIYERKLKNILKTYDSILVYSKTKIELDKDNTLRVTNMNDLMKAQQLINKPIIYQEEEKSSKFILKDEDKYLTYTLKI